jgi:hypothetical protein
MASKLPALLMLTHSHGSLAVCAYLITTRPAMPAEDGASPIHVLVSRSAPGIRARAAMSAMAVDGRPRTYEQADAERAPPRNVIAPGRPAARVAETGSAA